MSDDNKERARVPMCRDCADFGPICPNSGKPCTPPAVMPAAPSDAVKKLGRRLAELLDEDHWAECEPLLFDIETAPRALVAKWRHAAEHLGLEGLASLSDCADELEAALSQTMQPQAAPSDAVRPCEYCDDTGDVHGLDGEWRGVCICPAGVALAQPAQEVATTPAIPKGDLSKVWQAADDVCEWLNYEVSEKSPGLLKSIEILNEAMGRAEIRAGRAEPAAGEQAARNWIHGEAIDYLEVPDVQDESGINAHYSRDLVLQCIDAAIEAGKEQAGAVAQTPMFFASAEQANALQDRPDDDEGGVYLPLRKTAAGKFTMPLYAAPGAAIAAREQESLLSDEELSLLQRVEQDMQMFSEGRYPYDSNRMPNQKWRRATIADVERRFKSLVPRFAALTTKLMNASREEAPATPQAEPSLTDVLITANDGSGTTWTRIEVLELAEGLEAIASAAVMDGSKMRGEAADRDREWCRYQATYAALALRALTQPTTVQQVLRIHHEWSIRHIPGYSEHGDERVAYRATIAALNGNGSD